MFREARTEDFTAIAGLYHQLHPEEPVLTDRSGFDRILASEAFRLSVLEVDGDVVATTYLNLVPNLTRGSRPYAVVENVVVEESRRGTGLGQQIMAGTLQAAWDAGCYKVMLMTGSKRESTHAFYRACGFRDDVKQAFQARPPA
ncbi:GNAT family N-acetyltransferase [Kribbella italica]|uniref:N-acetylglutamate synthase-like GNAT family acetyltransferase n=1 Tax=Kribbella italica TaxID=1540520 RepID=A0A7W9JEY7_9ACTN|nr:N-acetylglutamate synthase-like GNAT family acetyltransferase [Kribbella italica]